MECVNFFYSVSTHVSHTSSKLQVYSFRGPTSKVAITAATIASTPHIHSSGGSVRPPPLPLPHHMFIVPEAQLYCHHTAISIVIATATTTQHIHSLININW